MSICLFCHAVAHFVFLNNVLDILNKMQVSMFQLFVDIR